MCEKVHEDSGYWQTSSQAADWLCGCAPFGTIHLGVHLYLYLFICLLHISKTFF